MADLTITPNIASVSCIIHSRSDNKITLLRDADPNDAERFAVEVPLSGTCSDFYLLVNLLEQISCHKFHPVFFTNDTIIYFRDDTTVCKNSLKKSSEEKKRFLEQIFLTASPCIQFPNQLVDNKE